MQNGMQISTTDNGNRDKKYTDLHIAMIRSAWIDCISLLFTALKEGSEDTNSLQHPAKIVSGE